MYSECNWQKEKGIKSNDKACPHKASVAGRQQARAPIYTVYSMGSSVDGALNR